jgi:hypothetical protein
VLAASLVRRLRLPCWIICRIGDQREHIGLVPERGTQRNGGEAVNVVAPVFVHRHCHATDYVLIEGGRAAIPGVPPETQDSVVSRSRVCAVAVDVLVPVNAA